MTGRGVIADRDSGYIINIEAPVVDLGDAIKFCETEHLIRKTHFVADESAENPPFSLSICEFEDIDGKGVTLPFVQFERAGGPQRSIKTDPEKIKNTGRLCMEYGLPLVLATRIVFDRPDFDLQKLETLKRCDPIVLIGVGGEPGVAKSSLVAALAERYGHLASVWNFDLFSRIGLPEYRQTIRGLDSNSKIYEAIKRERNDGRFVDKKKKIGLGERLDQMIDEICDGSLRKKVVFCDLPGMNNNNSRKIDVYDVFYQSLDALVTPPSGRIASDFSDLVNAIVLEALEVHYPSALSYRSVYTDLLVK